MNLTLKEIGNALRKANFPQLECWTLETGQRAEELLQKTLADKIMKKQNLKMCGKK